jgi:hypothetical protein
MAILGMPQNFIESVPEQAFLLPPDVREWLAADHLAWFVIDPVKEMDLRCLVAYAYNNNVTIIDGSYAARP